nr:hypothetical protein [Tanacetum cinerariifolium]
MELLIQTCLMPLAIKTESDSLKFVHELKQEMHTDLKYVESLEKEIDELEYEKAEFSDMYNEILQDCVSKDVKYSYSQSLSDLDALVELQCSGKSMDTKFDKPSVVRQTNAQQISKPSVLGKPAPFLDSLERKYFPKTRSVSKANVSKGLSKPVTAQTSPQTARKAFMGTVRFGNDHLRQFLVMEIWFKEMSRSTRFTTSKASIIISSQLVNFVMRIWRLLSGSQHVLLEIFRAIPTQAWLWHRRLFHLNFDYINLLSKKDIMIGLPKFKYVKDQLCSSCNLSKAKRSSFKSKAVPSFKGRINLLHMDLCGPMRVASINRKKYILVIVDDYSRGTEFLNKTLNVFFKKEGIEHQTSTARTPEQNDVVERRNRTLVEAARTMLSASQLPLFFWAEAIATACYTKNRSIIIPTHGKTPYQIINDMKPSIKHLHIFSCICYITRDGKNLDKMKEKGDQCILVGYSTQSKGYRVYNKRTRMIVESIHICFDKIKEVLETSVANNTSGLVPQRQKASYYDPDPVPQRRDVYSSADADVPSQQELDVLFGPLYDEFLNAGSNLSMNVQPTQAPSTHTNVHAEENNNDQAEEGEQFQDDEFTNPFCAPAQEEAKSSS